MSEPDGMEVAGFAFPSIFFDPLNSVTEIVSNGR